MVSSLLPWRMATEDYDNVFPSAESLASVPLDDAPILLFVCFHKALRSELSELRQLAVAASEGDSQDRELVLELRQRFEFLKLVCKYHTAAEDEVTLDFCHSLFALGS